VQKVADQRRREVAHFVMHRVERERGERGRAFNSASVS
jgi:hypothetical protein